MICGKFQINYIILKICELKNINKSRKRNNNRYSSNICHKSYINGTFALCCTLYIIIIYARLFHEKKANYKPNSRYPYFSFDSEIFPDMTSSQISY